jgi:hypothetical protein
MEGGDHSFHLPKSLGKSDDDVMKEIVEKVADWGVENLRS